ncbi:hypothetical protein ONZ45_g18206 [Pleurotus djamor]|nr:hypothetical protein ONZ45_g18206 [Pleurotus djamor]
MACDVNARDWLGMTVLHHACAGSGPTNLNFVRMLLAHPGINVNICDLESHWTPLHRAMYNGNLLAALLLLRRQDIDTSVKDFEGYTAFDLYNSTVEHSKPDASQGRAELYTWGANRNACLGQGDGNDRAFPDQVVIQPKETPSVDLKLEARFSPINVRGIEMSRLHTAIVTTEHKGNLRLCGFGSGGRLGPGQQAQQYALKPLAELSQYTIVSVALGQDHTLALTNTGEVLSWGLNRFAQLGYVIEPPSGPDMSGFARKDEPIQATPRKIPGSLKKAFVLGVAACKTASACWTSKEVFTWGTNHGQLGYDKSAQPIQIQPRVVTKLPFPAIDVALSDTAMVCLVRLDNGTCNLYYLHNDVCSKLSFPPHAFPAQIYPYRPPQSTTNADIQKVSCCDDNFAALSANGEVFMFSFGTGDDVALGSDGSLIICTESGHVYVRTRSSQTKASGGAQDRTGGNKPFKFQRVPFLQRVVRVCANSTGAFGALKVGFQPTKIIVKGNVMQSDVRSILPCIPSLTPRFGEGSQRESNSEWSHLHRRRLSVGSDDDNGEEDTAVVEDQAELARLCDYVSKSADHSPSTEGLVSLSFSANHGADMWIQVKLSKKSGITPMIIPVHRVLLAARSLPLAELLTTRGVLQGDGIAVRFAPLEYPETSLRSVSSPAALHFEGCLPLSVLILLVYLYSDRIIALWDTRIRSFLPTNLSHLAAQSPRVKDELRKFAKLVSLPHLATALESPAKRDPVPTLCDDLASSFNSAQTALSSKPLPRSSPSSPDVLLKLKDHQVLTHSTLLRARSLFFASMFDEEDWTVKRWGSNGLIEIDLTHLKWRPMQYVTRFLACGEDEEMFSTLSTIQNPDELLDLMFSVMAAANELLLDRLVLLCSSTILKFLTINNACYILDAAAFFHAHPLISSVQEYMAVNMETMLESHMLNDLSSDLIEQLSRFVQTKQAEKLPVSRSGILVVNAAFKHHDWLESQDIATPIVVRHSHRMVTRKASAKLSPSLLSKPAPMSHISPSVNAPQSLPAERQTQADDIFAMDEPDLSTPSPAVWKASSVPRYVHTLRGRVPSSKSRMCLGLI